jgi:hypothetical protein
MSHYEEDICPSDLDREQDYGRYTMLSIVSIDDCPAHS